MMSFGFTDGISSSLKEDLTELETGYIPYGGNDENLLFTFYHNMGADGNATAPMLDRIYKNENGEIIHENIISFDKGDIPNTGENISKVLECIRDKYNAENYGLLISSHGTGWTPPGYVRNPRKYEEMSDDLLSSPMRKRLDRTYNEPVIYVPRNDDGPIVKSIGATWTDNTRKYCYETDIRELADAIPFKMEYIIFDACYMGGIEVAYELKDKCKWLCASQTEILSNGMDYTKILERLIQSNNPNPEAVCSDYFNFYEAQSGVNKSATISMVDCSRIDVLAAVCRNIFRNHNISYDNCDKDELQQFFRGSNANTQKWFYDLRSVLVAAGANELELADIDWALNQCIVYEAATEQFMPGYSGFDIKTFSGLSMYLPYPERSYLNNYYKELAWNQATGLVK